VSLLNRFRPGHLRDRQFARIWTAGGADPHLESCAVCRARYEEFDRWVMDLGDTLRMEADAAFPAERLAVQQAQIARRLEALERPARVIAFPKAARAVISGHSHVRRWVTVAAAAGLFFAGIGLGQVVDMRRAIENRQRPGVTTPAHLTAPVTQDIAKALTPETSSDNDADLLSDAAFSRPHDDNLAWLDDNTPHARDIISRRKE
jgi:hypothetical protein